ncbi:MAG: hypothetical protein R3C26_20055 [Calditrichia bacterium]
MGRFVSGSGADRPPFVSKFPIGSLSLDSLENRLQHLKSLQNYVKTLSHDELLETVLRIAGDSATNQKR